MGAPAHGLLSSSPSPSNRALFGSRFFCPLCSPCIRREPCCLQSSQSNVKAMPFLLPGFGLGVNTWPRSGYRALESGCCDIQYNPSSSRRHYNCSCQLLCDQEEKIQLPDEDTTVDCKAGIQKMEPLLIWRATCSLLYRWTSPSVNKGISLTGKTFELGFLLLHIWKQAHTPCHCFPLRFFCYRSQNIIK